MRDRDLERLRAVAMRAALRGGEVVRGAAGSRREATAKAVPGDWVTGTDVESERAIKGMLAEATPQIPVHGEEEGGVGDGLRWLVDPVDGTTNFIHGFVAVGVSVALVEETSVLAGAIHAPFLGETWTAAAGDGARWQGRDGETRACAVSRRPWAQAVVGTGFPFRRKDRLDRYLPVMRAVLESAEDLRRPGAASLDLAWVASGVFEGFFELGLAPWDVAAGGLVIREAGGIVSDWAGGDRWLEGDIVAGSPDVWEELTRLASS